MIPFEAIYIVDLVATIILIWAAILIPRTDDRARQALGVTIIIATATAYLSIRLGWISYPILFIVFLAGILAFQLERFALFNVESSIHRIIGKQSLRQMRDDIVHIVSIEGDSEETPDNPDVELQRLRVNAKTRIRDGELIFSTIISVLLILLLESQLTISSILPFRDPNFLIELFLLALSISVVLREALLNAVTYRNLDHALEEGNPETALRWQKVVCEGPWFIPLGILIAGLVHRLISEKLYFAGIYASQLINYHDYGHLESMFEAISALNRGFENERFPTDWIER